MGSAASRYPDWDAKPCEAINDVDGGTPCDVPRDELEKAKARYDALKREHRKDQAALATAGDALLEELGLAVAFHDAGSWTRVVARKNVPDPVSETHEPHEHMHEPHSPGTWLLRERPVCGTPCTYTIVLTLTTTQSSHSWWKGRHSMASHVERPPAYHNGRRSA